MHTLFQAVIRWEMVERNPIDLVRQSGKRLKKPRVLTPAEFKSVLEMLSEPYKMMVIAAPCQYSNDAERLHPGSFRGKTEGGF